MKIKLIISIMIFCGILFVFETQTIKAQKVEVDQSVIDNCTKAFETLVEQRKVIADFLVERKTNEAERASAQVLIKNFDELIKVKDQISDAKDKIIVLYERVIQIQFDIIEKLEKRLLKPRSFFQKFLQAVKETLLILGSIALGRGL